MPTTTLVPVIKIDRQVDVYGRFYPGSLLELIRAIRAVPVGSVVEVLSCDPGTAIDIPTWTLQAGHEYLGAYAMDGYTSFLVRKTHGGAVSRQLRTAGRAGKSAR